MRLASLQAARRNLAKAAETLEAFRGGGQAPAAEPDGAAVPPANRTGLKAVLRATLERLREATAELETAHARVQVLEEEIQALREASSARDEDVLRAAREARALEESGRARAEVEARLAALAERNALLQAECVRIDALRRKAAQTAEVSESERRAVEEVLRRELQAARAEAAQLRARGDEVSKRLLHFEVNEGAQTARSHDEIETLKHDLARAEAAAAREPAAEEVPFVQPALEPVLEPGWARLLRLVGPPIEAAYAHLRRLSAAPLSPGHRALVRLSAASIAQAADALSSVELVLEDAPPAEPPSSVQPVLESALAAWESSFRRQGVRLVREAVSPLPAAAHEPKALRVVLYHILRNALEALPRGGKLAVRSARAADGSLRLEFRDDGPGYPAQWLERRFQPFASPRRGRAGLGLALVRKTLRRWGGDAEAANGADGRGACLVLSFAPPPAPLPEPG